MQGLTPVEKEILKQISLGLLYKEIANERHITLDGVKKHCKNIYKKIGVRNRTEACLWYTQRLKK